jgi:uncharacterized protein (DUF1330 family)
MPHLIEWRGRPFTVAALATVGLIFGLACSDSSDDGSATPTVAPSTPLGRLTAAYGDSVLDPSAAAWEKLLADEAFDNQPVAIVEFARLQESDAARSGYDAFVVAFSAAITKAGGNVVSVNDILFPGLEGLEGYAGGVSWVAEVPSLSAYVDALLDDSVVAVAKNRRDAISAAQVLVGPNLVPEVVRQLPPNEPSSDFPSDRVQGKSPGEIVDELLAIYPSGGADPTKQTLEAMVDLDGFTDQRVHFINLYRFNDDPGGGAQALGEYNAGALPVVLAHGGRPKVLVNVTHHLVGPTAWDRFIFVSWPSLAVFTDLRLDPVYVEAQRDRVSSAEQYGNLITIARADRPKE